MFFSVRRHQIWDDEKTKRQHGTTLAKMFPGGWKATELFLWEDFLPRKAKELEEYRSPHVRQALAAPLHGTSLTAEARFDSSAPAMARAQPEGVLQEDRLPQMEQSRLQDLSRVGEASRSGHFRVGFSEARRTCVPSKVRGKM